MNKLKKTIGVPSDDALAKKALAENSTRCRIQDLFTLIDEDQMPFLKSFYLFMLRDNCSLAGASKQNIHH